MKTPFHHHTRSRGITLRAMLLAALAVIVAPRDALSGSIWTAGSWTNNEWSQEWNWAYNEVPAAGAGILMGVNLPGNEDDSAPDGSKSTINNLPADTLFAVLYFTNASFNYGVHVGDDWIVSGNPFGISDFLGLDATTAIIQPKVQLESAAYIEVSNAGTLYLPGGLGLHDIGGGEISFQLNSNNYASGDSSSSVIDIAGPISGLGGIHLSNSEAASLNSRCILRGNNTYTGTTTIESDARLVITSNTALGSTGAETTLLGSSGTQATLELDGASPLTVAEPLDVWLDGRLVCSGAGATWTGPITTSTNNSGQPVNVRLVSNSPLTVSGMIQGGGPVVSLRVSGSATTTFSGTASNPFAGEVEVYGTLNLNKTPGVTAIAGAVHVDSGGTLLWSSDNQIADVAEISMREGTLNLNGHDETVVAVQMSSLGGVSGTNSIDTGAGGTLRVNGAINCMPDATGTISGTTSTGSLLADNTGGTLIFVYSAGELTISATTAPAVAGGFFTKQGEGVLRITGSGLCSAPVILYEGTLIVNNSSTSSTMPVTLDRIPIEPFVTLGGTGRVGPITAGTNGGIVNPGEIGAVGTLRSGNVTLNAECSLFADVKGSTAGTGYDQLSVTGTVNLGGAGLLIDTTGYNPSAGASHTIIANDGIDAVVGTFNGLPQGALLANGRFTISYTGGTGNDVVLIAVAQPTGVTRTWTGNVSQFWSNSANWSPGNVPQNGDALVFPASPIRAATVNDIGNLSLQSITFNQGVSKSISGAGFAVAAGIQVTGAGGATNAIAVPVVLTGPQSFSTGPGILTFSSTIDTNGMVLTFHADSQVVGQNSIISCTGAISEGGGNQFTKTGNGFLVLGGDSTTQGALRITAGEVFISHANALGTYHGATTVDAGATLTIGGTNLAVSEPIFLSGVLKVSDNAGAPSLAAGQKLKCSGAAVIQVSDVGVTQFSILGSISGSSLKKTGLGALVLGNTANRELTLGLAVDAGKLTLNGGKLPGLTTIGTVSSTSAELELNSTGIDPLRLVVNPGSAVRCYVNGITMSELTLLDGAVTHNPFTLSGPLTVLAGDGGSQIDSDVNLLAGISTWTVENGTAAVDFLMSGDVLEPASTSTVLIKAGAGFAEFIGNNASLVTENNRPDQLIVQAGTATWSGFTPTMTIGVYGGATFGGSNTVLSVATNPLAIVAPGASPGIMKLNSLDMGAGATLAVELNGTTAGTGYDQIICTGNGSNVDISTAALAVSASFTPPAGQIFRIIDIQGTGAVTPIAGLPEGSILTSGGGNFLLSYAGGTGNDVTLRFLPAYTGVARLWDGGGGDSNWSTPANWDGDTLPQPGDILVFNNTAPSNRRTMTQDLPAAIFQQLIFTGSAVYTLNGSKALTIMDELTDEHSGSGTFTTINVPVSFEGKGGTVSVENSGSLIFTGAVNLGPNNLLATVVGGRRLEFSGVLSGSGMLIASGAGDVRLSGSSSNLLTGGLLTTTGRTGVLSLLKSGSAVAAPCPVLVNGGELQTSTGSNQIADTLIPDIKNAIFRPAATETVGGVRLTGASVETGSATLTVAGSVFVSRSAATSTMTGKIALGNSPRSWSVQDGTAAVDLSVGAIISGSSGATLNVSGGGLVRFTGANTYSGATTVSEGTLQVNGTHSGTGAYGVSTGATLGGIGSITAAVNVSGTLAPGQSIGTLATGALTFAAGSTLAVEIDTTTVTADKLNVTGGVDTGGAVVNLALTDLGNNATLRYGTKLTLVDYTGVWDDTDIVHFNGSPVSNGSSITLGANMFRVDYSDDDHGGTAMTLTVTSGPKTPAAFAVAPGITASTLSTGAAITATISGPSGAVVIMEASNDLGAADPWLEIARTLLDASGSGTFNNITDPGSIGASRNFFRMRIP